MKLRATAAATLASLLLASCSSASDQAGGSDPTTDTTGSSAATSAEASPTEPAEPETATEEPEPAAPAATGPRLETQSLAVRLPDKTWRAGVQTDYSVVGSAMVPRQAAFSVVEVAGGGRSLDEDAQVLMESAGSRLKRLPDTEIAGVEAYRLEGPSRTNKEIWETSLGCSRNGIAYTVGFTFYGSTPKAVRDQVVDTVLGSWTWK